jgi:cobaltochelatase CobN
MDLGLQVALPELDGRLTTRIGAFKETRHSSDRLASALARYEPDGERIGWVCQLVAHWIDLRQTLVQERRVALVLANYPTRNSRLANGVGLDTPASTALMLGWMQAAGYGLGSGPLPVDGDALIGALMAGLTNDPESGHHLPLDHLALADGEAEGVAAVARAVELLPVGQGARVVHADEFSGYGFCSGSGFHFFDF